MNQAAITNAIAATMPAARATGLFSGLATFQQPSGVLDALGVPDGQWLDVAGLTDIPCMNAPQSELRIMATEQRATTGFVDTTDRHILLNDYFPTIEAGWRGEAVPGLWSLGGAWRVLIDDVPHDLAGVESDSQQTQTRITARVITI